MKVEKEIARILKEDGAFVKRTGNHTVWQLSNGRNFVQARTASDHRNARNDLRDLKKALGLQNRG